MARLPGGLLLSRAALDGLIAELRATGWERFSVPQFKERFALSRKWAIPRVTSTCPLSSGNRVPHKTSEPAAMPGS